MITHITSSLSGSAYWLVADPSIMFVNVYQFATGSQASITTAKTKGVAVDSRTFKIGDPVLIALPVGQWKLERSMDGKNWSTVGVLISMSTAINSTSGATGLTINLLLNSISTSAQWTRYTMIKGLSPLPDDSFYQTEVNWLTSTMLGIANTLKLPFDQTLTDLPAWAINVMSKLPPNTVL